MIHPILSLPALGPFSSSFIEGIWNPAWRPLYTGISYADRQYAGQDEVAGSVNLLAPGGGRFDPYPYPFTVPAGTPPGAQTAYPQIRNFASPFQSYKLPADSWDNSTGGIRIHTLAEDAEMTAFYWHGHQFNPTAFVNGSAASGQNLQFRYPDFNDFGATINRPVYFRSEAFSEVPLVLRS